MSASVRIRSHMLPCPVLASVSRWAMCAPDLLLCVSSGRCVPASVLLNTPPFSCVVCLPCVFIAVVRTVFMAGLFRVVSECVCPLRRILRDQAPGLPFSPTPPPREFSRPLLSYLLFSSLPPLLFFSVRFEDLQLILSHVCFSARITFTNRNSVSHLWRATVKAHNYEER